MSAIQAMLAAVPTPGLLSTLLLHGDGTDGSTSIVDSSGHGYVMTNTNVALTASNKKFGASSIAFNGYNSRLDISSLTNEFGAFASAFGTIDCWVYLNSSGNGSQHIWQVFNGDINHRIGLYLPNNVPTLYGASASGSQSVVAQASSSVPTNTWTHVAVERFNGTMFIYINGTVVGSSSSPNYGLESTAGVTLGVQGYSPNGNDWLNGAIDEFRLISGNGAYRGTAFAVPVAAYAR